MNTYKSSNVPLRKFIKFLEAEGLKQIRIRGGHLIFSRSDLARSIPIQSHIDPVPEFIVLEVLNVLDMNSDQMWERIGKNKGTKERKSSVAKKGKRSGKK